MSYELSTDFHPMILFATPSKRRRTKGNALALPRKLIAFHKLEKLDTEILHWRNRAAWQRNSTVNCCLALRARNNGNAPSALLHY